MRDLRIGWRWLGALVVGWVMATGCASDDAPATPVPVLPVQSPAVIAADDTPTAVSTSTAVAYDSNSAMYKVFPGFGRTSDRTFEALEEVRLNGDRSLVVPLVESMRFQSSANAREATAGVLQELTGQAYGGDDWNQWMEWLGRHRDEFPLPDEYIDWKISFMSQLDPRFGQFLRPALEGAITVDPTEIVWGGVLPDGIPDIRNPKMLAPEEAVFLKDDERVFGVSINGDARAYPLRIANAHEMVNDVVGGEPLALAY